MIRPDRFCIQGLGFCIGGFLLCSLGAYLTTKMESEPIVVILGWVAWLMCALTVLGALLFLAQLIVGVVRRQRIVLTADSITVPGPFTSKAVEIPLCSITKVSISDYKDHQNNVETCLDLALAGGGLHQIKKVWLSDTDFDQLARSLSEVLPAGSVR